MTPERIIELNALYADMVDIMDMDKTTVEKLTLIGQMMWDSEIYGCKDPNASNYCSSCLISTDTCTYLAATGGEG